MLVQQAGQSFHLFIPSIYEIRPSLKAPKKLIFNIKSKYLFTAYFLSFEFLIGLNSFMYGEALKMNFYNQIKIKKMQLNKCLNTGSLINIFTGWGGVERKSTGYPYL